MFLYFDIYQRNVATHQLFFNVIDIFIVLFGIMCHVTPVSDVMDIFLMKGYSSDTQTDKEFKERAAAVF